MGSTNREGNDNYLQEFSLVIFIHKGRKRKKEQIDIVPTKWLIIDNKKMKTPFLDDPIKDEDALLMDTLVKTQMDAPSDWILYTVKIIGRAQNYEDACAKLELLKKKKSVLTCGSDEEEEDVQDRIKDEIKRNQLRHVQASLRETFQTDSTENKEIYNQQSEEDSPTCVIAPQVNNESPVKSDHESTNQERNQNPTSIEFQADTSGNPLHLSNKDYEQAASSLLSIADDYAKSVDKSFEMNLPVLNIDNSYKCKSEFEQAVMNQFLQMQISISEINRKLDNIENLPSKKLHTDSSSTSSHDFVFPLNSMEDFEALNKSMKSNKYLKNEIIAKLRTLIHSDGTISRSYINMLRYYFTKDVAKQFTALRASNVDKTKVVLKTTEFCRCMDATIINKRKHLTMKTEEKDLNSALSDVLSNVKNWKTPVAQP